MPHNAPRPQIFSPHTGAHKGSHADALSVIRAHQPQHPVMLERPHAARQAAVRFSAAFKGKVFYAVKSNASPAIMHALHEGGITHFDVASLAEVKIISEHFPQATKAFMNPIKAQEVIAQAYNDYGVRIFSLDSHEELAKILRATNNAQDLTLCVRLRVPSKYAKMSLANKFGARSEEIPLLLQATRKVAQRLGLCFHVGSQTMLPQAYEDALEMTADVLHDAEVQIEVLDVGGGFPSAYEDMKPPALHDYFKAIHEGFALLPCANTAELWCEPGRALSAEYSSLLVRVEHRRGHTLYINDGGYGSLYDACHENWLYPLKLCRETPSQAPLAPFDCYGPTCDDLDYLPGPFMLPEDMRIGDYFEIGMMGAYSNMMRSGFNGFDVLETVQVEDAPMLTMYI